MCGARCDSVNGAFMWIYLLSFSEDALTIAPANGGSRISRRLASQSYLLLHFWGALVYQVRDLRLDCKNTDTESPRLCRRDRAVRCSGDECITILRGSKGGWGVLAWQVKGGWLSFSTSQQRQHYDNAIHEIIIIINLACLRGPCLHSALTWKHSGVPRWQRQSKARWRATQTRG